MRSARYRSRPGLPYHAIDYCLAEAGIALADVDHVAYSYDPWFELDRDTAERR